MRIKGLLKKVGTIILSVILTFVVFVGCKHAKTPTDKPTSVETDVSSSVGTSRTPVEPISDGGTFNW